MRTPSPGQIERAMTAALQLKQALGDTADSQLLADCLEGETDVYELIDRLAEAAIADRILSEIARGRAERLEKRSETFRETICRMLQALDLGESLQRPAYTASISHRSHVIVTDPDKLSSTLMRSAPDKQLIAKLLRKGEPVAGALLSNPEPTCTLRTN